MTDIQLANFIKRLELELEDIGQELECLPLSKPDCKIGDFGCGEGFATLSLMLHLDAFACTGVDKSETWQLPSIGEAKRQFSTIEDSSIDSLSVRVKHLLNDMRFPQFQLSDVLKSKDLPKDLDLAYCKKLLVNIDDPAYGNPPKSEDGLTRSINNIVNSLKQGGLFCLVEKISLKTHLMRSDLKFLRVCLIERGVIKPEGREHQVEGVFVHLYRKL
jgi:SAM-dependent methyltransferase